MANRRTLLAALPAAALATPALAQRGFPERSVRVVVPYGPGGSSDIVARILGQRASEITGQSFVVENRGGGASIPGTQVVVTAAPDGYTIGTADNALAVNPALQRDRMPFDTERDVGTLGLAVTAPLLFLANPNAPARTLGDIVAAARARPGAVAISHGGIGTPTHLALVQLQIATGLEFNFVGYRGGGPQLTGLVTGEAPYGVVAISSASVHVEARRLRPVAITSPQRSALLPDVPTTAESGWPAVNLVGWWGFIMPAAVPADVTERLHAAVIAPAREPALRQRLEGLGYNIVASRPAEFQAQVRREVAQWRDIAARVGMRAE
jgi:tripartite-type tricarboxylate transporter receptor subunit TctC